MKSGTLFKGLAALSTVGGIAAATTSVVTNVVEIINVENVHEINEVDVYELNGVRITKAEFEALSSSKVDVYYGVATDPYDLEAEYLSKATVASSTNVYTVKFSAFSGTDEPDYESQYPVFILPSEYTLDSFCEIGISCPFETYTVEDYSVSYITTARYDADLGGSNYTVSFH